MLETVVGLEPTTFELPPQKTSDYSLAFQFFHLYGSVTQR